MLYKLELVDRRFFFPPFPPTTASVSRSQHGRSVRVTGSRPLAATRRYRWYRTPLCHTQQLRAVGTNRKKSLPDDFYPPTTWSRIVYIVRVRRGRGRKINTIVSGVCTVYTRVQRPWQDRFALVAIIRWPTRFIFIYTTPSLFIT